VDSCGAVRVDFLDTVASWASVPNRSIILQPLNGEGAENLAKYGNMTLNTNNQDQVVVFSKEVVLIFQPCLAHATEYRAIFEDMFQPDRAEFVNLRFKTRSAVSGLPQVLHFNPSRPVLFSDTVIQGAGIPEFVFSTTVEVNPDKYVYLCTDPNCIKTGESTAAVPLTEDSRCGGAGAAAAVACYKNFQFFIFQQLYEFDANSHFVRVVNEYGFRINVLLLG